MAQTGAHQWARTTTTTTNSNSTTERGRAANTLYHDGIHGGRNSATATIRSCTSTSSDNATSMSCCGLSRLMRKLKIRHSKMLRKAAAVSACSRQSSFKCRYDPLSYALNFDTSTESGSLLDNEDYYVAFSSRFVAATPRTDCHRLMAAAAS